MGSAVDLKGIMNGATFMSRDTGPSITPAMNQPGHSLREILTSNRTESSDLVGTSASR